MTKYVSKIKNGSETLYVKDEEARDLLLIPIDVDTLTPSSTFVKNNIIGINGVLYIATANTSNLPVTLATQGNSFVVNTIDGKKAFVVADSTLNSNWKVWSDASLDYWRDTIETQLDGKQATISDLSTIRSGATAGSTAYQKPSDGIPATDLTSSLQNSIASIDDIEAVIPSQATSTNQLADKEFVNSSISTATAEFKGTFTTQSAMEAVTADENDYAFLVTTDSDGNTVYNRYKYSSGSWVFEFALNNSSFTAAQWSAIQSGITSALVSKLSALPTNASLTTTLNSKANTTDLSEVATSGSYLDLSDTPVIPTVPTNVSAFTNDAGYLTSHQDISGKADKSATVSAVTYDTTNGKLTKTINGATSDVVSLDTTPTSGSKKPVTSGGVYSAIADVAINAVDVDSLTTSSTFKKNDVMAINGVLYIATADTSNMPVILTTQNGSFVTNVIDGRKAFVVADTTLQTGWRVWSDASLDYWRSTIESQLEGKQATISDLSTIRSNAATGATAYQKPSGGIPSTDMTSAVQASLALADSAYQKASSGIPATDLASSVQSALTDSRIAKNIIYRVVEVTGDMTDQTSTIGGSDYSGYCEVVIYHNATQEQDYTISTTSTMQGPSGPGFSVTCPSDGYCEIRYINVDGWVIARGF